MYGLDEQPVLSLAWGIGEVTNDEVEVEALAAFQSIKLLSTLTTQSMFILGNSHIILSALRTRTTSSSHNPSDYSKNRPPSPSKI
jgi:hypothetical protein